MRRDRVRKLASAAFVCLLFAAIVSPVAAVPKLPSAEPVTLRLSDIEGEPATAPYPDQMDATLEFSVVDSILTLEVTNLTPEFGGDPALNIDEIYFNGKENITSLELTGVSSGNTNHWLRDFIQGGDLGQHQVGGFGRFDMYVKDKPGNPDSSIGPGGSLTFTFEINGGVGSYSPHDFIELSTQVDGTLAYAAAKFFDGGDMSDFGGTEIPEPATVLLLGLGALALLRRRGAVT